MRITSVKDLGLTCRLFNFGQKHWSGGHPDLPDLFQRPCIVIQHCQQTFNHGKDTSPYKDGDITTVQHTPVHRELTSRQCEEVSYWVNLWRLGHSASYSLSIALLPGDHTYKQWERWEYNNHTTTVHILSTLYTNITQQYNKKLFYWHVCSVPVTKKIQEGWPSNGEARGSTWQHSRIEKCHTAFVLIRGSPSNSKIKNCDHTWENQALHVNFKYRCQGHIVLGGWITVY